MGESEAGPMGKVLVALTMLVGVFLMIAMALPLSEVEDNDDISPAVFAINFILYVVVGLLTIAGVLAGNKFALAGAALLSFAVFGLLCAEIHYQLNGLDGLKADNDFSVANGLFDCKALEDLSTSFYGYTISNEELISKCKATLAFRFLAMFGLLVTMPLNVFVAIKM